MSKTKFKIIISTICLLLALIPTVTYAASNTVLNEKNNGDTITVPQGNTITLSLEEAPSAGYVWKLTTTPGLEIVSDRYVSEGPALGTPGYHTWVIKTIDKGAQQVYGEYKRSWETKPPVNTFKLSVKVVAK